MNDWSLAIRNALDSEFPRIKHGKCFFHMKENIRKTYRNYWETLESYIDYLGNCCNTGQIDLLWNLIKQDIRKNKNLAPTKDQFFSHFERVYLNDSEKNFFIGYLPVGFGNTNNLLEGHHRDIKANFFEYKIFDMGN